MSGRAEVVKFAAWFVGVVEKLALFEREGRAFADPGAPCAKVRQGAGSRQPGGPCQDYVVFLQASSGKIATLCPSTWIRPALPRR